MIVKVNDRYLELNDLIEVDKKVKLFEDVSKVDGDFSYSFSIPRNQNNDLTLSIFLINNFSKPWTVRIPTLILNDSGIELYSGFIRVEEINDIEYLASFFSGNSNWLDELDFSLLDIDWSEFDTDGSTYFTSSDGVVTPLTDRGMLLNRKSALFSEDDFQGYIYAKDVVNTALRGSSIKISGSLLKDPNYKKLITSAGTNKSIQDEIDKRSVYAANLVTQNISSSYVTLLFPNVSSPYNNSPNNNWDTVTSRYTFDILTKYTTIEYNLIFSSSPVNYFDLRILKNGTTTVFSKEYSKTKVIRDKIDNLEFGEIGDYYQIQLRKSNAALADRTLLVGSWIKVYPTRFYKIFTQSIIPDMTASTFIANIFRMFNVLANYNPSNKTINTVMFDKVLESEPIDISDYVTISDSNFEDFVSDYAKNNLMLWKDQSNDFVDNYNESNQYPYASGILEIDNDFLEDEGELIEMDFSAPWQQTYGFLGMDLPLTDFGATNVVDRRSLTGVTEDTSGGDSVAVFNYSGAVLDRGYVVRISESTIDAYNGEYYAVSVGSQFFAYTTYLGNATGVVEILEFKPSSSDPVFLLNNPNLEIGDISAVDVFYVGNLAPLTTIAVANFLPTDNFIGSLSFNDLKGLYFNNTERLLNNGVKSFASGNIPEKIFNEIDFTRTVKINEFVFYVNKISGYKGSQYETILELIKK